ncbi:Sugar transporter [Ranunculus cassubicifolius]
MVEGGIQKASKAQFLDLARLARRKPYILLLALSAAIGGFLFGYDTGVISGASLYIQDDFESVRKSNNLQAWIVSCTPAGAIVGAAAGGLMNDSYGRKKSIIIADIIFTVGAILMSAASTPLVIIIGRGVIGIGVGMASMTAPLYISEASPTRVRGALVSFNGLLITGGQFIAYLLNLFFTRFAHPWRWMLGVAGVPSLIQLVLMLYLPESPRWLYRKGKRDEAIEIMRKVYLEEELDAEIEAMKSSVEEEIRLAGGSIDDGFLSRLRDAWSSSIVRKGLVAGIGVQVFQQFVGINTVMYYSPTIIQFAGFISNSTAIALSLITSGLNAFGSIASMLVVDRYGRKKLMIYSLIGIIFCLGGLAAVFKVSDINAPKVDGFETARFGNSTCPAYFAKPNAATWNCRSCLDASSNCAFCSNSGNPYHPGACVAVDSTSKGICHRGTKSQFFTKGCPAKLGWWAIVFLGLYIISYSPGMGTAPWIVNSEIYPLRHRGVCGGIAAVSNWTANLIVSYTFLLFISLVGSSYTFIIFAGFSFMGLIFIAFFVPETKGLSLEGMENMLENRNMLHGRTRSPKESEKTIHPFSRCKCLTP